MTDKLLSQAERFETKARSARKTECSQEYQAYWLGYAEACDEAASALRNGVINSSSEVSNG